MQVLVTGANGMLGQDLCPILEDEGFEVIETDKDTLDITNWENIDKVFSKEKPDIVIHCAAYTNVDKAEEDLETARLINSKGTENIAKACKKFDAVMVYISTDYVFDGKSNKPYLPEDKTSPINNYGITKLEGENAVRSILNNYYICRTSWLYGIHGKNFVEKMLALAGAEPELARESESSRAKHNDAAVVSGAIAEGTEQSKIAQAEMLALAGAEPELACESESSRAEIKVVDDQTGCPTWTVDLSKSIVNLLIDEAEFGIYHICGGGQTTRYEFAKEIFKQTNVKVNLQPCSTEDFKRPANRPEYSVMNNNKSCRSWKDALKDYLALR